MDRDLVADRDGLMENHAVQGDGDAPSLGQFERRGRPRQIHMREQPAAEDVPFGIGVGRHGDDATDGLALRQGRKGVGHALRLRLKRNGAPDRRASLAPHTVLSR